MYVESTKREQQKERSLHAERNAILKCTECSKLKYMAVVRIKKSGKLTGGECCQNCKNFINKTYMKINLKHVHQYITA